MATAMDRAVNLPEIVSRFAWFLWLCEPNEELVAFVFYPQDVVASSQVGRAWCGSLLPLLGRRIDDGEEMERWSIAWPNYLSPHCRPIRFNIATLIEYSLPNLLQEIEVCILIDHTQARQVLHRLTWSIPNTRDPNTIPYTDVIMALEPLSSEVPYGVTLLRPRKNRSRLVHGELHGAELELRLVVPTGPDGPDLEQSQPGAEDPTGRTLLPLRPMQKPARVPQGHDPQMNTTWARGGAIRGSDQNALLITSIERLNSLELNFYKLSDEICGGILETHAGSERFQNIMH
ncbi:hypothetical protein MVEG_10040 [Podila verticillata NRRL 6337]|nr:hypothetical protein MVEG_10040 [Podila verticillata NRRL 6337]